LLHVRTIEERIHAPWERGHPEHACITNDQSSSGEADEALTGPASRVYFPNRIIN